jgi:hypothetical protein
MSIKIHDIHPEMENLTTVQIEKINGGDNPGMAPPEAYQAGVTGYCSFSAGVFFRGCRVIP